MSMGYTAVPSGTQRDASTPQMTAALAAGSAANTLNVQSAQSELLHTPLPQTAVAAPSFVVEPSVHSIAGNSEPPPRGAAVYWNCCGAVVGSFVASPCCSSGGSTDTLTMSPIPDNREWARQCAVPGVVLNCHVVLQTAAAAAVRVAAAAVVVERVVARAVAVWSDCAVQRESATSHMQQQSVVVWTGPPVQWHPIHTSIQVVP